MAANRKSGKQAGSKEALNGRPHPAIARQPQRKSLLSSLLELRRDLKVMHAQADARLEYLIAEASADAAGKHA